MTGSMGSPPPATSCEGCSGKKQKAKKWEEAKREYDSVGGTPFHGVRAIAKKHNVFISPLKRIYICLTECGGYPNPVWMTLLRATYSKTSEQRRPQRKALSWV